PQKRPLLQWRSHCNILYTNWLNYYVYQITPYILEQEPDDTDEAPTPKPEPAKKKAKA
ncbi:MAG: homoserine O-succinyltransferase, partial [Lachnospiraceae bacterium]|nr:homoserine O-succinyltransferase [Lachnospiraceae bacterium]